MCGNSLALLSPEMFLHCQTLLGRHPPVVAGMVGVVEVRVIVQHADLVAHVQQGHAAEAQDGGVQQVDPRDRVGELPPVAGSQRGFQPGQVGVHDGTVPVHGEDQRHVDRDAGGDRRGDGGQAGLRRGDLDDDVVREPGEVDGLVGQGLSGTIDMRTIRPLSYDGSAVMVSGRWQRPGGNRRLSLQFHASNCVYVGLN